MTWSPKPWSKFPRREPNFLLLPRPRPGTDRLHAEFRTDDPCRRRDGLGSGIQLRELFGCIHGAQRRVEGRLAPSCPRSFRASPPELPGPDHPIRLSTAITSKETHGRSRKLRNSGPQPASDRPPLIAQRPDIIRWPVGGHEPASGSSASTETPGQAKPPVPFIEVILVCGLGGVEPPVVHSSAKIKRSSSSHHPPPTAMLNSLVRAMSIM
jgi:hypothetical protein